MADSMYGNDFFIDSGIEVKREPTLDMGSLSASVPIPPRRPVELGDLPHLNVDLDLCVQDPTVPLFLNTYNKFGFDSSDGNSKTNDTFKMEDDDIIFQVDKADLIQGPTLAELNANDDTLLDDLNFDDLLLPEESGYYVHIGGAMVRRGLGRSALTPQPSPATPSLLQDSLPASPLDAYARLQPSAFSPCSQHSSASSAAVGWCWGGDGSGMLGQSVPAVVAPPVPPPGTLRDNTPNNRLSTSAPTHLSLEQIWQRREPRKHLLSTSSIAEAGSVSSLSGSLLSPEAYPQSQDEDERYESDEDSDRYEDLSSDGDSDGEEGPDSKHSRSASKKERFFWQYNVQAKGPKGQRLFLKTTLQDPHILNAVTDPVFSPNCSVRGIKHSGKARKGDGNDLTPNPKKLFLIGKELDGLARVINDMTPVSELPYSVRPKTRKEKNKLASRACRLKKKAQHEANKLKLHGLQQEHRRLLSGIEQMKQVICRRVSDSQQAAEAQWKPHLQHIVSHATQVKIAGSTSDFVNTILDKVKSGNSDGGLDDV